MKAEIALAIFFVAGIFSACASEESDLHPVCERAFAACTRGGVIDVCCSERGCAWIGSDGSVFYSSEAALGYCAPASGAGRVTPSPAGDLHRGESSTDEQSVGSAGADAASATDAGITAMDAAIATADASSVVQDRSDAGPSTDPGSDPGTSEPPAEDPRACYGSPVSCSVRYTSGSCLQDWAGCFWEESYCGGAAYSCGYFTSASGCNAQGGCLWSSYTNDCRGGAWQCPQRYTYGSCYDQLGCYWVEGGCFGSAGNCSSRYTASSCNDVAGCYWR